MDCIILVRMPSGGIVAITKDDESGEIEIFPSVDAALDLAVTHSLLKARPYQIVECDEL